jgi:hypothetical protein
MSLTPIRIILTHFWYIVLALAIAYVVFTFAVWLPNTKLILTLLTSNIGSFWDRLSVMFSLYGSIATNFTTISASYAIAIAILFGINIALLTYYIRTVRSDLRGVSRTGATSIGGLVFGVFGIGCAACGTFILTSVLALFGASGILIFLPFGGEEFGFIGVGLLVYSIYVMAKKMEEPLVCEIV